MNEIVNSLHGIPVCLSFQTPLLFSKKISAFPINQSDSFAQPAVMGITGIELLSQSTPPHGQ